jgi:hypothetical protein
MQGVRDRIQRAKGQRLFLVNRRPVEAGKVACVFDVLGAWLVLGLNAVSSGMLVYRTLQARPATCTR